jgi:hypothetical protein
MVSGGLAFILVVEPLEIMEDRYTLKEYIYSTINRKDI